MKKILTILIILTFFLTSVSGISAATGINRKINFQGKVVNKGVGSTDGTNVPDGNYDFKFSLWSTLSAGTSLWSEVWNSGTAQVAVNSGIFQVALGTYKTFPPTVDFNSDSLYVSINFNNDGEMAPRIQMAAVPYAFNAEKVGGLTVTNTTGVLTIGNTKVITFGDNFTTIAGVGITLDQSLSKADSPTFAKLGIGATAALYSLNAGGTAAFVNLYSSNNISVGAISGLYRLNVNGDALISTRLGIGATNALYALNVGSSAVNFGGSLVVGGTVNFTGLTSGVGSTILYIDSAGNIISGTLPTVNSANNKVIVLSPEFPGASLSADGSGTTAVAMTSDNTLNSGSVGWKNYYQLTSDQSTLQDYSVLVRVTLPSDFDSWQTGTCPGSSCALEINYQNGLATTADNFVSVKVDNDTDTPGTEVCSIGTTASTGWGASGCTESVLNDGAAPEWDASGETAIIRVKLGAKNTVNALSRLGDIVLRYKSKF